MTEPAQRYEIRFQPAARRAIAQRLPEAVAAAVLEFCDAPDWRSIPSESANRCSALSPDVTALAAGTYRIVYQIDENGHVVHVLAIDHRSQIYRRRRR